MGNSGVVSAYAFRGLGLYADALRLNLKQFRNTSANIGSVRADFGSSQNECRIHVFYLKTCGPDSFQCFL